MAQGYCHHPADARFAFLIKLIKELQKTSYFQN